MPPRLRTQRSLGWNGEPPWKVGRPFTTSLRPHRWQPLTSISQLITGDFALAAISHPASVAENNHRAEENPMNRNKATESIDRDRRRLLGMATMGIAVTGAASLRPSQPMAAPAGDAIRPFRVDVPEEQLVDLRRRVLATRWPDSETVADRSQGVRLRNFQELLRYWGTD